MQYEVRQQQNSGRGVGLAAVAIIHVIIGYGLWTGLGATIGQKVQNILEIEQFEIEKPKEPPPPPPPPEKMPDIPPPPAAPPPLVQQTVTATVTDTITTTPTVEVAPPPPPPVAAPPPPPPPPPRTGAQRDDRAFKRWVQDINSDYPPTSQRLGEQGTVNVQLYVGEDGRIADCRVTKSSGFERLDKHVCQRASGKRFYAPAVEDGRPVGEWVTLPPVRFVLQN
jgi:periplasmic protein TonB